MEFETSFSRPHFSLSDYYYYCFIYLLSSYAAVAVAAAGAASTPDYADDEDVYSVYNNLTMLHKSGTTFILILLTGVVVVNLVYRLNTRD